MAKKVLESIGSEGQNTRKYYQRRLPSNPSKDYYFIHRETGKTEPLLIEYGFIDSPQDDVTQLKNNLLNYAEGVVRAVADYAEVPYQSPAGSNYYTVKPGDSLWKIANQYGFSVDDIILANNLQSNILNIGQSLKIPKEEEIKPGEYAVYTVQKNDSLWKIANQFGITVDQIKKANNLTQNDLYIGQKLYIPDTNEDLSSEDSNIQDVTYIVQSGDSLWNIAKKYNISVNELKEYNNLTSNLLSIGQKLSIPNTNDYKTYTVQAGDSLWKIANMYGITVDDLIKINNLNNNLLSIGQVLLIPSI